MTKVKWTSNGEEYRAVKFEIDVARFVKVEIYEEIETYWMAVLSQ